MNICARICLCICACIHIYIYVCMHICISVCVCVPVYVCVYVHVPGILMCMCKGTCCLYTSMSKTQSRRAFSPNFAIRCAAFVRHSPSTAQVPAKSVSAGLIPGGFLQGPRYPEPWADATWALGPYGLGRDRSWRVYLRTGSKFPKGPRSTMVYTWALRASLSPYFEVYVGTTQILGPFGIVWHAWLADCHVVYVDFP